MTSTFKKCIILDLDNTTWGGIIGDDGLENIQIGSLGIGKAFSEFTIDEKILIGFFLCSNEPNDVLQHLEPEWNIEVGKNLKEK